MPNQRQVIQSVNTFSGGLNTESNPLNFPENTIKDGDNVDIIRNGSAKRRRGLNFEVGGRYSNSTVSASNLSIFAITTHDWTSVDGDDNINFSVVQIGGVLYFYELGTLTISDNPIGSIDLAPIRIDDTTLYQTSPISADSGNGKLFIVSMGISPAYIQYNEDDNTFTGVKLTLKIRDLEGILEDEDSPIIFGDDIDLPDVPPDPDDDEGDIIVPLPDPGIIGPFVPDPENIVVY